uniref:Ovule protein n=1 Tax=Heligmosomoides polygyrus TaxID=6339 RepID=A0A183FKI4_HELPZ
LEPCLDHQCQDIWLILLARTSGRSYSAALTCWHLVSCCSPFRISRGKTLEKRCLRNLSSRKNDDKIYVLRKFSSPLF